MIRGKLWELLSDESMQKIDAAAMHLLTKVGARVEHEEVLGMLEAAGCKVSKSTLQCCFSEKLVRDAVDNFRKKCKASEAVEIKPGWNPVLQTGHGGSFPHVLDWPSCRRRLATVEDVRDLAKMAHMLPEFASCGQVVTCAEVDARIEPIWNAVERFRFTDKPIYGGEVLYARNVKHLVRLGEIAHDRPGDTSLVASCDFSVAPLIFGRRMLECVLEKRRFGIPHVPGTMPVSGISAPVTLAGTVAVCVAELLGGWAIGYLVRPDLQATAIVSSGSLDMRVTRALFGSPEALLQDTATVQACRRLYGIPIHAANGYVDCKRPGIEATYEKLFLLLAWPFQGYVQMWGGGLLSAGQDYSPVQHLLELDMYKSVERFLGSFEVTDETLALDVVAQVASTRGRTFLDTEHTGSHYRGEQWYPRWLDRRAWQGDDEERAEERQMLDRIDAYWRDAVGRWTQPEIDRKKLAEMEKVLAAAAKEMEGRSMQV